jgi:regulator of sigma E protease
MIIVTIIVFFIVLSILVLIHEWGHFIAARKFGIKVEEFGFGFPPRLFGKKKGETTYTFNALPFGGFVKLYGEDDAGGGKVTLKEDTQEYKDLDRAYFSKPAWQRAIVVVAGVVMNLILAAGIYYAYLGISNFKAEVPLIGEHTFFGVNQSVRSEIVVGTVVDGSPADTLGLTELSRVTEVNGRQLSGLDEFIAVVNANKGQEITLTWQDLKTQAKKTGSVTPRINPPKGEGALGVGLSSFETAVLSYDTPVQKVFSGITHSANLLVYNTKVIGSLIAMSFERKSVEPVSQGVSGPVGIAVFLGDILNIPDVKERVLQLLNLVGVLSLSLAFFNILPIPALDGGRFFFTVIEMLTGKKIPRRAESIAHSIGFAVLITLLLFATFRDITNLF